MKTLLEAINRGILRGLNEQNIELLSDLDDDNLDQLDSIQTKSINNNIHALYKYFPTTKEELVEIIKGEVKKNGWNCNLNHIDTSKITDMSVLFCNSIGYGLYKFNGDISRWDVSNVENMHAMFHGASDFNQPIGDWDVSNVTAMASMFEGARSFNQPIGDWIVSSITNMRCMFADAKSFNQDVSNWKLHRDCEIDYMFTECNIKNEYKLKGK